ncbi:hypothetical protein N3K66_003071 [Trichothecium roseum]|uniref:Uncharacterized protein n=1 Tax=Trichothecium roseum TaxID=47278 RepID=A0ACC0V492_9HYPO|nr:hypothetical protein N3K66_003071 [Trichothecium roseum]
MDQVEMEAQALSNFKRLLQKARDSLELECAYEVNTLHNVICSSGKIQYPHPDHTGLPSWIKSLERAREDIGFMLLELDPKGDAQRTGTCQEENGQIDERLRGSLSKAGSKQVTQKLDAAIITLTQAALIWSVIKHCQDLRCVFRTFVSMTKDTMNEKLINVASGQDRARMQRTLKEQSKVDVTIVNGGYSWLCIRTIGEARLARQMTDAGWSWGDHKPGDQVDADEWEDIPFVSHVQRLVSASRINRWEYAFPNIILVLTAIDLTTAHTDVKILLDQFRRLDSMVKIEIYGSDSDFLKNPPPLGVAIRNLLADPHAGLTPTLNLDHTILIDLISDITHLVLEPQEWQAPTTRAQIEEENMHEGGVMAATLYSLLKGRKLECTQEVAKHFHEVLRTVGTSLERTRGRILVPDPSKPFLPSGLITTHEAFNARSFRPVPASVQIPITVRPVEYTMEAITSLADEGTLPPVAVKVCEPGGVARNFPPAKRSVYVHGWATGNTTLTSNKEISGQMKTWVEAARTNDSEKGPRIWKVDVTRNLLAKNAEPSGAWIGSESPDAADC